MVNKEHPKINNCDSYSNPEIVEYYFDLNNRHLFKYEEALIDKYFGVGGKVLDIGCGAGRTTLPLGRKGYDVIGLDYSKAMIERAKTSNHYSNVRYTVQDIINTSFNDNEFDNALFSFNGLMLIYPLDNRIKAMCEISRIIKPGGLLIFTTPFLDNKLDKPYWKQKINSYRIANEALTKEDYIIIGDEIINDNENDFFIHIPMIEEVKEMITKSGFSVVLNKRRLDLFSEEINEEELDDNYIWVVENE